MRVDHVAIFCGSSFGCDSAYAEKAKELALALSARHIGLVYGAGNRGLMGLVGATMEENGAHVIGVTPKRFVKNNEGSFPIDEYIVVDTMHERKDLMYKKSDAFIILPGGIGTLEEFSEIFTWRQLGYHGKPVILFNINGFYDPLLSFLDKMVEEGFFRPEQRATLFVSDSIDEILDYIDSFKREKGKYEE